MQTIETRPYPKKLHKYDYPHIGPLCKEIRESRGVPIPPILEQCNRSNSTITRNLERDGNTSRRTFRCYVKVLRSESASPPLTRQQGDILMELFDYSKPEEIADRQCELSAISLEDIKPGKQPDDLIELMDELEREDRPAFIFDSLYFVHALNGALLHLFEIDPQSEHLYNWYAWHVMGAKFHTRSPVGAVPYQCG